MTTEVDLQPADGERSRPSAPWSTTIAAVSLAILGVGAAAVLWWQPHDVSTGPPPTVPASSAPLTDFDALLEPLPATRPDVNGPDVNDPAIRTFDADELRDGLDQLDTIGVDDVGDFSAVLAVQTGAMIDHDDCKADFAEVTGEAVSGRAPTYFC